MDEYFYNSGKDSTENDQLVLEKLITPKKQIKYINNLFNRNEKDFQKFIRLIKNIKNWKDASILIDFYYYKNGVKPNSKDALELKDIVYRIYFPLEK